MLEKRTPILVGKAVRNLMEFASLGLKEMVGGLHE
jgi:hypothetical protein